ncbi:hypothetical protein BHM03_00027797, partial [Ensete ventricosum]
MQQLGVAITGEKSSHLKLFVMSSPLWFAISTCTARYGRYISVRQVIGRRTARYRAKKEEEGNKEYLASAVLTCLPSSPAGRLCAVAARGCRGRFLSRARRRSVSPREEIYRGD